MSLSCGGRSLAGGAPNGPGSGTPADAEQALVDAGGRLLTDLDEVGGTDDDRRRVLLAGALMGWHFDVDGVSVDAAAALAEMGLNS